MNSTQLRGIHQGMVSFAQANKSGGRDGFFPGIEPDGTFHPGEPSILNENFGGTPSLPSNTVALLLNGDFFPPEYCANPADRNVEPVDITVNTAIGANNFSYAMLELNDASPGANPGDATPDRDRADEWRETLNTAAPVISDKNTGADATVGGSVSSVWTQLNSGNWRGTVARNDNSTSFQTSPEIENTRYGSSVLNEVDNLFAEDGDPSGSGHNDAAMVINAWGQYTSQQ